MNETERNLASLETRTKAKTMKIIYSIKNVTSRTYPNHATKIYIYQDSKSSLCS